MKYLRHDVYDKGNKGFPVIKKSRAPVYLLNPIKTKYEAKPKGIIIF